VGVELLRSVHEETRDIVNGLGFDDLGPIEARKAEARRAELARARARNRSAGRSSGATSQFEAKKTPDQGGFGVRAPSTPRSALAR
jgi:hypothetical protein